VDKVTIREALEPGDPVDAPSTPHLPWDDDEHRAMACRTCGLPRVFRRRKIHHSFHFILAMGTVGAWLPVWGVITVLQCFKPWTCTVCGAQQRDN